MCRWMAYSGEPILAHDLLFRPQHSLIDQSLHSQLGATTTNGDGFGNRLVRGRPPTGSVQEHRTRVERLETCAKSPPNCAHPSAVRSHPRLDGNCQCSAATVTRSGTGNGCGCTTGSLHGFHDMKRELVTAIDPVALSGSRRIDGLGNLVLPRADVRPERRSVRRCREGRRIRRAHGPLAGNRQSGSDDRRHVGWHLHLDLSLFQRAPVEVVVLLHRDFHVAQAPSRGGGPAPSERGDPNRRLRASARPSWRLETRFPNPPQASSGPGRDEMRTFVPIPPA